MHSAMMPQRHCFPVHSKSRVDGSRSSLSISFQVGSILIHASFLVKASSPFIRHCSALAGCGGEAGIARGVVHWRRVFTMTHARKPSSRDFIGGIEVVITHYSSQWCSHVVEVMRRETMGRKTRRRDSPAIPAAEVRSYQPMGAQGSLHTPTSLLHR